MATNWPGALDTPTDPTPESTQLSPSHAGQHAFANDAIVALQTDLGTAGGFVNRHHADPTGASISDSAFQAAYEALGGDTGIGNLVLGIGDYWLENFEIKSPNIGMVGPGKAYCRIDSHSIGEDTLRVHNPSFDPTSAFSQPFFSGEFDGFRIDGTNAGTDASGLHYGDLIGGRFGDILVQNFTGTESVGVWMDNVSGWCERMTWGSVQVNNCTTCIKFDVNSGASSGAGFSSFAYNDFGSIKLGPLANQDGIVISNGALVVPLRMDVTGNYGQSLSGGNTGAMLRIAGSSTSAGGLSYSSLTGNFSHLGETDWDGGSGTTPHQTIVVDSNFNNRFEVTGFLYFINGWTATNCLGGGSTATFLFHGFCFGDSNISDTGGFATLTTAGGTAKALGPYPGTTGVLYVSAGDAFDFGALYQSVAVTISGTAPNLVRDITVYGRQAASGGPFNLTWPASPLVQWDGGAAPTVPTAASHGFVYRLHTSGNGTWYGEVLVANAS